MEFPKELLPELRSEDGEMSMDEQISKKAALVAVKDALMAWSYMPEWRDEKILEAIAELPSAQPEVKQISYTDCANAMLMMWMDKVLTDGEYNRIMDKLNEHEKKKRGRQ